jgi:hypothetical protein
MATLTSPNPRQPVINNPRTDSNQPQSTSAPNTGPQSGGNVRQIPSSQAISPSDFTGESVHKSLYTYSQQPKSLPARLAELTKEEKREAKGNPTRLLQLAQRAGVRSQVQRSKSSPVPASRLQQAEQPPHRQGANPSPSPSPAPQPPVSDERGGLGYVNDADALFKMMVGANRTDELLPQAEKRLMQLDLSNISALFKANPSTILREYGGNESDKALIPSIIMHDAAKARLQETLSVYASFKKGDSAAWLDDALSEFVRDEVRFVEKESTFFRAVAAIGYRFDMGQISAEDRILLLRGACSDLGERAAPAKVGAYLDNKIAGGPQSLSLSPSPSPSPGPGQLTGRGDAFGRTSSLDKIDEINEETDSDDSGSEDVVTFERDPYLDAALEEVKSLAQGYPGQPFDDDSDSRNNSRGDRNT